MAINAAHWTVTRSSGDIRYTGPDHDGAATYATVIEFHRWLQDLADDAASAGDDEHDITDGTSSDRSTDNIITLLNGYNIDDGAAEHLYDGSIIQTDGDEIYDGIVNFGNADVQIQIIQNGAVLSDDWWNEAGAGLNPLLSSGVSHRFMIKTRTAAADIDGRRLIGTCRRFGETYSEFSINGTSRGNNVFALKDSTDLNNQTVIGTVAGWTNIDNTTEGFAQLDVDNDGSTEDYYSEWNRDTQSINDFYERMKWLTREASASTIYGLNGELFRGITHDITVDTPTGTFNAFEPVSWAGGTGQMLAINSPTAATRMWIQLLTGIAPTDGQTITGGTSSATVDMDTTIVERSISAPFIGISTGAAIVGAYGVGIEPTDLTSSDLLFDLDANPVAPPNFVTFTVAGLVSGEDRVLVTNDQASDIDYDQMTLNGALTGGAVTAVVVNGAIPADTPSTGTIRIERDSGQYTSHAYTSWTGSTFTIGSTDFSVDEAADGNNTFLAYLDLLATGATESFTGVYASDRTLFIRVRDGGGSPIKTFETTGTLGINGGSATAIRTSDA